MSKHTPGPWFYTTEGKDAYGIVEQDGTNIMHMQTLQNSIGARHMEANMRLIAAAPDLLDALSLLVAGIEDSVSPTFIPLAKARDAIVKATGEAA